MNQKVNLTYAERVAIYRDLAKEILIQKLILAEGFINSQAPKEPIPDISSTNLPSYVHPKEADKVIETSSQNYAFKIYNGRIKVYCDGYVMFSFNQIDFSGYYAYKDDTSLYGIDIYMNRASAGHQIMEVYFKTKETWLAILRLLDENL
jgi:hypothetical protein